MKKLCFSALAIIGLCAQAATITVNSLDDDNDNSNGNCSLREAIKSANTNASVDSCIAGSGADTIEFATSISGQSIILINGEMIISEALTINGGSAGMTIDANNNSRIFNATAALTLDQLILTKGKTTHDGGVILSTADLTITNSTLSGNKGNFGGAIFSEGELTLKNSTLSDNKANQDGGAILSTRDLSFNSSLLLGNTATNIPATANCHRYVDSSSSYNLLDVTCGSITNNVNNNLVGSTHTVANTLEPLADNGCVTQAGSGNSASCVNTMALKPGAAAIDNGNDSTSDQRGFARDSNPDIGAFEFSAAFTLTITPAVGGRVTGTTTTNRDAITDCQSSTTSNCAALYMKDTNVEVSANAATGYSFSNWSGDCSGSTNPLTVKMSEDKTCQANFTLNTYTLSWWERDLFA